MDCSDSFLNFENEFMRNEKGVVWSDLVVFDFLGTLYELSWSFLSV